MNWDGFEMKRMNRMVDEWDWRWKSMDGRIENE